VTQDWSNDAENTAAITGMNYIFTYSHIKTAILNYKIFHKFHSDLVK